MTHAGCTHCYCGCPQDTVIGSDVFGIKCDDVCCRTNASGCVDASPGDQDVDCPALALPGPVPRAGGGTTYGPPSGLAVTTTTDGAGLSPGFTVKFDVMGDTYQTAAGSVAIPDAYGFNGFLALGPERTQVGLVGIDFDQNDIVDVVTTLRASTPPNFAYPDLNFDGRYTDGIDPDIELTDVDSQRFIDFTVPSGGDGRPGLLSNGGAFRVFLYVYPGIFTNPMTPDDYTFEGLLTAVDPDTGGENDFQNAAPLMQNQMAETTVTASALSNLDPFVCYAAKSTRGTICTVAAPANAGAACDAETDCGGTPDVTVFCAKNKGPVGYQAVLADPLETKSFDVKKTHMLCAPGFLAGTSIIDPETHLRDYKIKETRKTCGAGANEDEPCAADSDCPGGECVKTPKHAKEPLVAVQNALGIAVLSTKKVIGLMAPTSVAGPSPAPPPGLTEVDPYKCYSVKFVKKVCAGDPTTSCKGNLDCGFGGVDGPCLKHFPKKLGKSLDDTYTIAGTAFALKGPKRLCLAAAVDGATPENPNAHLLCYRAKPLKKACDEDSGLPGTRCRDDDDCGDFFGGGACDAQPKTTSSSGLHATNALGRERVDRKKPKEVCFPTVVL